MDATLKEVNLKKSIKKFFVDGLPGRELNFDKILTPDIVSSETIQWVSVLLEGGNLDTVSEMTMSVYLFTRKDKEGFDLSAFSDEVIENLLYDGTMDLFNTAVTPWAKIGGVDLHILDNTSGDAPDNTKMKSIQVLLKWTAKW